MSLDQIALACRTLLLESPQAEDARVYLDTRLNPTTQELFGFGYFPAGHEMSLLTSLISERTLTDNNLMYRRDMNDAQSIRSIDVSFFENHPLIIPYRDAYGKVVALVGRSLFDDAMRNASRIPKYKNTTFTKGRHLFGLYEAKSAILEAGFAYVVEGQFDVIKAFERGLRNIVAVGSSNLSAYQLALLCRYTSNIVLLLDNDEAGQSGCERAVSKFGQYAMLLPKTLPSGYKDIDEYLTDNTPDRLWHNLALPFDIGRKEIVYSEFVF
jgi:DNA primase